MVEKEFEKYQVNPYDASDDPEWTVQEFNRVADYLWARLEEVNDRLKALEAHHP